MPRQREHRKSRRAVAAVGLYVALMLGVGCQRTLADRVLLHPTTAIEATYGASERIVETPVGPMQVWVARSASAVGVEAERYVLRLGGNGGRAERDATAIAARWGDVPAEVWSLNYPGYGQSRGPAKLASLVPAASAVWDALGERAGDDAPLYLDCDSMGTAVGLALAASRRGDRPAAGLVLKNPPPLRALLWERFGWWNLWLAVAPIALGVPRELDSIENARRCHAPAVYVRATDDGLIPPPFQDRIREAHAGRSTLVELEDADHNTPIDAEGELAIRRAIAAMTRSGPLDGGVPSDAEADRVRL